MPHSNYAVQQIYLEIKDGSGTFPGTLYAALFTTAPGLDGSGGSEIDAGTYTWYERKAVTWASPSLAGRTMANSAAVTFTSAATPVPSPLLVTHMGLMTASTSGNLWRLLQLTTPISIGLNSKVEFPIGQIVIEQKTTG